MITRDKQIYKSYEIAKAVFVRQISLKAGIVELTNFGVAEGSAKMILGQIFPEMMLGKRFTRTLSAPYFEYYLSNIYKDFGPEQLLLVLSGLEKHIQYNNSIGNPKLKLKEIYSRYFSSLPLDELSNSNEHEQEELAKYFEQSMSRVQIIKDLSHLTPMEPEIIIVNNKKYKRDNKTIAQIKYIREFKCQICNHSVIKKDGSKYVEAAHIIHKHKAGPETPDNILILCPNHHKEFDLGELKILEHNKEQLHFILNEKAYLINLKIF